MGLRLAYAALYYCEVGVGPLCVPLLFCCEAGLGPSDCRFVAATRDGPLLRSWTGPSFLQFFIAPVPSAYHSLLLRWESQPRPFTTFFFCYNAALGSVHFFCCDFELGLFCLLLLLACCDTLVYSRLSDVMVLFYVGLGSTSMLTMSLDQG